MQLLVCGDDLTHLKTIPPGDHEIEARLPYQRVALRAGSVETGEVVFQEADGFVGAIETAARIVRANRAPPHRHRGHSCLYPTPGRGIERFGIAVGQFKSTAGAAESFEGHDLSRPCFEIVRRQGRG